LNAYEDISSRIGPRALIAPMVATSGVELLLGMFQDAQFGPVVMLGAGGLHVEALADVAYALPPFSALQAARLLASLRIAPLLHSKRHRQPLAVDEFCRMAAQFSSLVAGLGPQLAELDLNPVIVHAGGCTIVDALIVPGSATQRAENLAKPA